MRIQEQLEDPEVARVIEEEFLYGEATDTITGLLASLQLSQKELATRLGVSEGRVSQIVNGSENLTLRSLAAVGWALGVRFTLQPIPMANRKGSPAAEDPPLPAWLSRLGRYSEVRYTPNLRLPPKGRLNISKPVLRVMPGERAA